MCTASDSPVILDGKVTILVYYNNRLVLWQL
jgi:hypothetical protein